MLSVTTASRSLIFRSGSRFAFQRAVVVAALCIIASNVASACETPVYRYAMYRWQPAPYEVYFLHDGSLTAADRQVESQIEELSEGTDNRANIVYLPVNLTDDPDLLSVPPDVKQAWLAREDQALPSYLVSSPYGVELHSGALGEGSIPSLVDSPARKSLATQLESGKVGVFLFLKGEDSATNQATRAILDEVVADVGAGKISLYVPPAGEVADDADTQKPQYELGLIEIDRQSEEESWLVKSLLAVEPDLAADQRPMVFLVYGRARALLPYIGKGISRENLLREVEFISGACSCTVKEQNPGVDLLVRYDWEAAAAALAERVGTEEGNATGFGSDMFFPELVIPSGPAASSQSETADRSIPAGEEVVADIVEATPSNDPAPTEAVAAAPSAVDTTADLATGGDENLVAALEPATSPEPEATGRTDLSMFGIVGGGLAIALVVLFGITLVVLRPQ